MKPAVEQALNELAEGLPDAAVAHLQDGDGGAFIIVDPVDLGPRYEPRATWIGFHLTHIHPEADIYPHHIDAAVRYVGPRETKGDGLPGSMGRSQMPGFDRESIQISLRTRSLDPATYTALYKLHRVIDRLKRK